MRDEVRDRYDDAGADNDAERTAGSTTPDDLGSTDAGPGLTSGGMGTTIDESVINDGLTPETDEAAFSDPEALGMGMDDSTGYLDDDRGGGSQA